MVETNNYKRQKNVIDLLNEITIHDKYDDNYYSFILRVMCIAFNADKAILNSGNRKLSYERNECSVDKPFIMNITNDIYISLYGDKLNIDINDNFYISVWQAIRNIINSNMLVNKSKELTRNPLTNLQSRSIYNELIDNFSSGNNIGICYIDANYLKYINDNYGHDAGDYLLITIANTIKKVFRIADIFHLGGDEFLVISSNIDNNIWEEKINELKELFNLDKQDIINKYNIRDKFFDGDIVCMGILYKEKITNSQELVNLIKIADQKLMDEKNITHERYGKSRRR